MLQHILTRMPAACLLPSGGKSAVVVIALVLLAVPQGIFVADASSWYGNPNTSGVRMQYRLESDFSQLLEQPHKNSFYLSQEEIDANSSTDDDYSTLEPPVIQTDQMALALKWTAELNRRLYLGTVTRPALPSLAFQSSRFGGDSKMSETALAGATAVAFNMENVDRVDHLRGGGGRVAAARPYRIPLVSGPSRDSARGHASSGTSTTGIFEEINLSQYPVDLEQFLHKLLEEIVCETNAADSATSGSPCATDTALERTLAMMYLDRACSVATPRSIDALQTRLPFCTPQTVHRLTLTSVLLAVGAVRGDAIDMNAIYQRVENAFGISPETCQAMEDWMRSALGDSSIFVTPDELLEWKRQWVSRFG